LKTGGGISDYYECKGNTEPFKLQLDKPIVIVGENQERVLKTCNDDKSGKISCATELYFNSFTGTKEYITKKSGTIYIVDDGSERQAIFGTEQYCIHECEK